MKIIRDAEAREIGTIAHVAKGWSAVTRAGIRIGVFADEIAAVVALHRYRQRHLATLAVTHRDHAADRFAKRVDQRIGRRSW